MILRIKKLLNRLSRFRPAIPLFTLLTAFLYLSGRELNSSYWNVWGLPLMGSSHDFTDMLYDGYLAVSATMLDVIGRSLPPVAVVFLVGLAAAVLHKLASLALQSVERYDRKRRKARAYRRVAPSPSADNILDLLDVALLYLAPAVSLVLATFFVIAVPILSALYFGEAGEWLAKSDRVKSEAALDRLMGGLVDATAVRIRRSSEGPGVLAIPIECRGDRCAVMTAYGPVSIPKDNVLEEFVLKSSQSYAPDSPSSPVAAAPIRSSKLSR